MSDSPVTGPGQDPTPDPNQTAEALSQAITEVGSQGALGSDQVTTNFQSVQPVGEGVTSDSSSSTPSSTSSEKTDESNWKQKYEELQKESEAARQFYQMVESDPAATELLINHYNTEQQQSSSQQDQNQDAPQPEVLKRLDALEQQNNALRTYIQVQEFARKTPDFEEVRPAMHKLSQELPNASLDRLYTLAKAEIGKSPKPLAGAEGGASGGAAADNELSKLQDAANQAQSMERAVDIAGEMWKRGHRA